jgi:hypothetical protein
MKSPEISDAIEASIVTLAGNWAKEAIPENIQITNSKKWEETFTANFNVFYTVLFRSVLKARIAVTKNTIIQKTKTTP